MWGRRRLKKLTHPGRARSRDWFRYVEPPVGPLSEHAPDEPFSLAVGLWPIPGGEEMVSPHGLRWPWTLQQDQRWTPGSTQVPEPAPPAVFCRAGEEPPYDVP
jgi:hypothetical protein